MTTAKKTTKTAKIGAATEANKPKSAELTIVNAAGVKSTWKLDITVAKNFHKAIPHEESAVLAGFGALYIKPS